MLSSVRKPLPAKEVGMTDSIMHRASARAKIRFFICQRLLYSAFSCGQPCAVRAVSPGLFFTCTAWACTVCTALGAVLYLAALLAQGLSPGDYLPWLGRRRKGAER